MKNKLILGASVALLLAGCVPTQVTTGGVSDTVTGSAGSQPNSGKQANVELQKCAKPIGVAALVEPNNEVGQGLQQMGLPSPIPVIKLLMAQSNCFQVVDRGAASAALQRERELAQQGQLASTDNTQQGQMVSADWVITPSVLFQDSNAGGQGAMLGALAGAFVPFGGLLGAINVNKIEAQTLLTAVSVRTGLQESVAEGSAKKNDISFGLGGFGAGVAGGMGSYASTDIGKIVSFAFMDAHNKLVNQLKQ